MNTRLSLHVTESCSTSSETTTYQMPQYTPWRTQNHHWSEQISSIWNFMDTSKLKAYALYVPIHERRCPGCQVSVPPTCPTYNARGWWNNIWPNQNSQSGPRSQWMEKDCGHLLHSWMMMMMMMTLKLNIPVIFFCLCTTYHHCLRGICDDLFFQLINVFLGCFPNLSLQPVW